jgi:DNA-binding response OmpR family regulator
MSRVWPDIVVDESNLKVQMAALRKVLKKDRDIIKTVHGRGYVFTREITIESVDADAWVGRSPEAQPPASGSVPPTGLSVWSSPRRRWAAGSRATLRDDETPPTVVVIDDNADIREALAGLLRTVGLQVELFASVHEFLDIPRPGLPGCLILDVRLPGRSGLYFQEELTKANLCPPIIFISGHADVPMSVRVMKAGPVEVLTKPVRDQDMLDAVQLAIAKDLARRVARPSRLVSEVAAA